MPAETPIIFDNVVVELASRRVTVGRRPVTLSELEFELLVYLARHANQLCTYEELLRQVWGYGSKRDDPHLVRLVIMRLRRKLSHRRRKPMPIRNVRGLGYCLDHSK
ncbi:MAG: winged helix-turn-helix domain-containing protein [Chloroflexota bacterium]